MLNSGGVVCIPRSVHAKTVIGKPHWLSLYPACLYFFLQAPLPSFTPLYPCYIQVSRYLESFMISGLTRYDLSKICPST